MVETTGAPGPQELRPDTRLTHHPTTTRLDCNALLPDYDALLIASFGGPEGPADVMPFLENVLRGRNVPRERMLAVARHYELFGGVSPLNAQNRALVAAVEAELAVRGPHLPVYWGNRNWHPLLADTLRQMRDDGIRRALAFVTSAYSSYSGCRQYREDVGRAQAEVGPGAPAVDKLRAFYNHPGFIGSNAARVRAALDQVPAPRRSAARLVFTAHSIPLAMAAGCAYEAQLREACRLVAAEVGFPDSGWALAFQSRSGPPTQAWLGPDILDCLAGLADRSDAPNSPDPSGSPDPPDSPDSPDQATRNVTDVVLSPIGFTSDHMEIVYDLDTEARAAAAELGLNLVRAGTAGTHPQFIAMIRQLIEERLVEDPVRLALGSQGPGHDVCPVDCCVVQGHPKK